LTLRRRHGSQEKALFFVALAELGFEVVAAPALWPEVPFPLPFPLAPFLVELEAGPDADDIIAARG
jgi:hypothetical protein